MNEDVMDSKNLTYFGSLLIYNDAILYGISLGKSHFYLQEYCDPDFGIDIGIKILNQKDVQTKNSKLFGGRKKKSLIIYKADTEIDIDSGESIVYLKGKTIEKDVWGKTLTCGQSALFSLKDLNPVDLPLLIYKIEAKLHEDPLFDIPRAEEIADIGELNRLNQKLVEEMISNATSDIEVEEQSLSGVEFIFSKDYHFSLKSEEGIWQDLPEQSIKSIIGTLSLEGVALTKDNIEKIKIRARPDDGNGYTKTIKYFLDYVDEEYNFLQLGKWYRFNNKYIDYLHSEIGKIDVEWFEDFSYEESRYLDFLESITESQKNNWYSEKYFNEKMAVEHGYINLDRTSTQQIYKSYTLEVADLYKDDTIYFVKIGSTQKQNYVIDQAMGTLKYLQDNDRKIVVNGEEYKPKRICLWMILNRRRPIDSLIKLKSFILLINILDWKKDTRLADYIPIIRISYRR